MRNKGLSIFLMILFYLASCKKEDSGINPSPPLTPETIYFPPLSGTAWESNTPASLGWNETERNNLYAYLQQKETKAF
jgi:hypothetical protein